MHIRSVLRGQKRCHSAKFSNGLKRQSIIQHNSTLLIHAMKTLLTKLLVLLFAVALAGQTANAQQTRDLQYFTPADQTGLNVFETPKENNVPFTGVNVRIGGSNTLQFQALSHSHTNDDLFDIGPNFNLATSNLDIDAQLADGLRMHLRTYLSSRHHAQPYVKGGYMQIDRLDFIQKDFLSDIMDKVTIKVGHMEINYGDAHFRRSDNGQALLNPFVGNYIMDAFTTEVGAEVYYQSNGIVAMLGATNGKLNQSVVNPAPGQLKTKVSLVAKVGYDKQLNEDLRVRLMASMYNTNQSNRTVLYGGDRAGSRYYNILTKAGGEFRIPRFDPAMPNELRAIMINPFVKFQGIEFFGVIESATGKATAETDSRTVNQLGAELLYRFGANENFYVGGRYNNVSGDTNAGDSIDITRINFGGGWFMTKNVLTKVEYVSQKYDGFSTGSTFDGAEFSGIMVEAVISF